MPVKHNKDYDPPWAEVYQFAPITTNNFKDTTRIPIFWGPGQLTLDYPNYTPPNLEKWRKLEIIGIPQVVRFIFASKEVYEDDEYNDDDDPPPPPPIGECPEYNYEILYSGWSVQLKPQFIGLVDLEANLSPDNNNYICNYDPPYCFHSKAAVLSGTIVVKNRNNNSTLYSGSIFGCTYLNLQPGRYLRWTSQYPGGGGTIISEFFDTLIGASYDRQDPDQPPICWIQRLDGTYFTEIPQGPYPDSLGQDGVCAGPFELWGCNSNPGSPPLFDPPTPPLSPPGP